MGGCTGGELVTGCRQGAVRPGNLQAELSGNHDGSHL